MSISFMDSRLWSSSLLNVSASSEDSGVNTPATVTMREIKKKIKIVNILFVLAGNLPQYLSKANYTLPLTLIFKALKPLADGFNISVILTFSKMPLKSSAYPLISCSAAISDCR